MLHAKCASALQGRIQGRIQGVKGAMPP